jgi:hypothetical protein
MRFPSQFLLLLPYLGLYTEVCDVVTLSEIKAHIHPTPKMHLIRAELHYLKAKGHFQDLGVDGRK